MIYQIFDESAGGRFYPSVGEQKAFSAKVSGGETDG